MSLILSSKVTSPPTSRAHWRVGLTAVVALSLASCMSGTPHDAKKTDLAARISDRGELPVAVAVPFEIDDEMRRWVHQVPTGGEPEQRLEQLLRAVLRRDGKEMTYVHGHTGSAREVWRTNQANCLSFAQLFVGLAREVGIPVYFLRVADLQSFERHGDLIVASEHITAAYGPPTRRRIVEFTSRPFGEYHQVEPISDITAMALYYSNLGAERIRDGHFSEAEALLRTAVRLDPELGDGWVNLGVALLRLDRVADAESAFRRALEANPRLLPAYQNLASLLERGGRGEEARALLAVTDQRMNRNPFSYLALGDVALRGGNVAQAERFYRRALSMSSEHAEPLAALGRCAMASGRRRDAQRWLARALSADPANERALELARILFGPVAASHLAVGD